MDSGETTIMVLVSQAKTMVTIRKKLKRNLVPRVQLRAIVSQATKAQKTQDMKFHRHQVSKVVLKIMMMERKNQKQPSNQRNRKIEYSN